MGDLGASYATLAELRSRFGVTDAGNTTEDAKLTEILGVASRSIEQMAGRQFNLATSATARLFYPTGYCETQVYDIASVTNLAIKTDTAGDGTYATTWASTDYQLEPLDGVVDGQAGWPWWTIRAVGSLRFPCVSSASRAPLQVTAIWGWTAVPAPVKEATLILAEELYSLKNTPLGVGGYGPYGIIRARENPMVMTRLMPYLLHPVLVA
jgi:hypothetical protein